MNRPRFLDRFVGRRPPEKPVEPHVVVQLRKRIQQLESELADSILREEAMRSELVRRARR